MKLWVLEAEGALYYDVPIWSFMGVFDSLAAAKADAERVTPKLIWDDDNDEDDDERLHRADVLAEYQTVFQINAWLIQSIELNQPNCIKAWSEQVHA